MELIDIETKENGLYILNQNEFDNFNKNPKIITKFKATNWCQIKVYNLSEIEFKKNGWVGERVLMNAGNYILNKYIIENIKAPNIVATIGCIKSPIEPKDAVSLGMLYVIKNWPPTWQSIAMANKLYISVLLEGKKSLDSIIAGINPNKHVNSVV